MDKLKIIGGKRLSGSIRIGGAKNASLPAMAASLLTQDPIELKNLPNVWDVSTMRRLLQQIGTSVSQSSKSQVILKTDNLNSHEASYELVKTMRASVLVLGPLLARYGRARVSLPGGCAIGARPIDQHIKGLKNLGAHITLDKGFVDAWCHELQGATIRFDEPTVGGTENILMAACLAQGETLLSNCAQEPEIVDLSKLLISMGASIEGAGTDRIRVQGVKHLHGASHFIQPDRIEAATYTIAGALIGDEVEIKDCNPEHLSTFISALEQMGVSIETTKSSLLVRASSNPLNPIDIETAPYPGFATDIQAQLTVLMTQATGTSHIQDTIFENRFMHVGELTRMGVNIQLHGNGATINGPTKLSGASVMATDLRASACLVLAGLTATGETVIDRIYHLDRGYENIEEKLTGLGAKVERIV